MKFVRYVFTAALLVLVCTGTVCANAASAFAKVGSVSYPEQHTTYTQPEEIPGKIEYWFDGDTCDFTPDKTNKMIRVRLWLVDAPESKQPGGKEATNYMIHHPQVGRGKHVILGKVGTDQYGRTLGQFKGEHAKDYITAELLASGLFWPYYPALDDIPKAKADELRKIFNATKAAKKGIFKNGDAVPPYKWRREHPRDK